MPNIKSAEKKVRQDKKRSLYNKKIVVEYEKAMRLVVKNTGKKNVSKFIEDAYSKIDKAVKKKIIHKKKGSRLKSKVARVAKVVIKKTTKK